MLEKNNHLRLKDGIQHADHGLKVDCGCSIIGFGYICKPARTLGKSLDNQAVEMYSTQMLVATTVELKTIYEYISS